MVTEPRVSGARQFFSRNGALSRCHPGYEFRHGQLEMAEAVEAALREGRHLIVEAGTGTGKTLAYLMPAILSGKRVVISTGTKNLQEQLIFRDIPFLEKHFGRPLRACYMKGRVNYACRQKIYDAESRLVLEGLEELADFGRIREWEKTTGFGDRAELRSLPEASSVWSKLDARGELCTGQKCPQFDRCFITLMHRRAAESDLIIVNHHLFFADLGLKQGEYGRLLPDYQAVVFDEAHEIEDVAGQYFGVSASNYRIEELRRDVALMSRMRGFGSEELDRVLDRLAEIAFHFFAAFGEGEGRARLARAAVLSGHAQEYADLLLALELLESHLKVLHDPPEEVNLLVLRARDIARSLRFVMESGDDAYVYWLERRGRGCFLQATPIDISSILAERLFDRQDSVILTSATLAVGGSLGFAESRLGLRHARSLIVAGHFDFSSQALLYVPQHLPDPRSPAFFELAVTEIRRLLRITRGRAFLLFTSHQQMRLMYDRISFDLEYPALLQGTRPRSALLEEFQRTPHAVLFATASFWQGVDVPGEQLSCVIIDRLPFAVPSDPVVEARIRNIRQRGGDPFYDYQIPQAATALKQGFGRLIRSRSDRGVLVLLDNRITRRQYGQVFFDSLPDYGFTTSIGEVEKFFDV